MPNAAQETREWVPTTSPTGRPVHTVHVQRRKPRLFVEFRHTFSREAYLRVIMKA